MIKVEVGRPGHPGPVKGDSDESILASEVQRESNTVVSSTLQLDFSLCLVMLFTMPTPSPPIPHMDVDPKGTT